MSGGSEKMHHLGSFFAPSGKLSAHATWQLLDPQGSTVRACGE
jgi:hypothetical protein